MESIKTLTAIDYSSLIIASFSVLIGIKAIVSLFEWFFDKLGIETKWMRKKREEHDLLMQTSKGLIELQKKHEEDIKRSDLHDEEIRQDIKNLTDMFIQKEIFDMRSENNNFENILIVDEKIVVDKFLNEFNVIMSMNTLYIQQLHVSNSYNILILEEEDNATVGIICNVKENELIEVKRKYYDICILYNLNGIYDKYDDFIVQLYDAPFELERINAEIEFEMQQYLCELKNLLEISIPIHGIGRIARDMYYGDFEDVYVKIIWKERFCVLLDRYEWN